jgi:hypothetical protein
MTTPIVTAKLLCNIVKEFLGLQDDQVWIWNQKRDIPTDSRLYVIVSQRTIANTGTAKKLIGSEGGLVSRHSYHSQETLQIDLISASIDAIARAPEVVMSFSSDYSQALQELHGFRLATQPTSIVDSSAAEVTRQLFRTTIEVRCLRAYTTDKSVAYYEQFEIETQTERGAE